MESQQSSPSRLNRWGFFVGVAVSVWMIAAHPIHGLESSAANLAGVTVLMATLWITQAIPIAVTSLVPLIAFPLLGIQTAKFVSKAYIDQNIFLYLGGFIIALGIERCGLHHRMALHIVRILGTSPRRMVLGFMVATGFLSMWISNTASTLLMLPIGLALISSLRGLSERAKPEEDSEPAIRQFTVVLLLGMAFSASIGGFTTLVGTPTNVQFIGIYEDLFITRDNPQSDPDETPPEGGESVSQAELPPAPEVSAGQWMLAVAPLGAVYLILTWLYLTWQLPRIPGTDTLDRKFLTQQIRELGPPRQAEWLMLGVFVTTAALWIFRKPLTFGETQLIPGWQTWIENAWGATGVHDSTVAMGMAVLLFLIPAGSTEGKREYLMDWETAERLPWGILLLIGGGFALAGAFSSTGLSEFLGREFSRLVANWPVWLLVAATCFLLTFLTELTSNVATVATLMPVLARAAVEIEIDPRMVMIPATIAASCAFMLPIATPPNAIVFGSGQIEIRQMARYGIVLNLIGVVLITLAMFTLLVPQLGMSPHSLPDWAKLPTETTSASD